MPDFDPSQLETDLGAICSPSYGGEDFRVGGATYYGVFNQTDQNYGFELTGNRIDATMTLVVNRGAFTPTIDGLVFRPFDATTYRVSDFKPDLQAFEITLTKPLAP